MLDEEKALVIEVTVLRKVKLQYIDVGGQRAIINSTYR